MDLSALPRFSPAFRRAKRAGSLRCLLEALVPKGQFNAFENSINYPGGSLSGEVRSRTEWIRGEFLAHTQPEMRRSQGPQVRLSWSRLLLTGITWQQIVAEADHCLTGPWMTLFSMAASRRCLCPPATRRDFTTFIFLTTHHHTLRR